MAQIMSIIQWCMAHWLDVAHAIVALLTGLIAVCMLIPGDQPEKFLQSIVDVIEKFSVKPSDPKA